MDEVLIIDAAERMMNGQMSDEESTFFQELRKNNPEIDQLVVEYVFFMNELEKYRKSRDLRQNLNEIRQQLRTEGELKQPEEKSKIIFFNSRYRKVTAIAASIAGIVSLVIASAISAFDAREDNKIKPLVEKINQQENKTKQIEQKVNQLSEGTSATPAAPRMEARFRATGFMLDASGNFIVTNAHVVNEAQSRLIIENNKGQQFSAAVIYVNTESDIAILRVNDSSFKKLPPVPFAIRKNAADLGENIFMLGFPKQEIVYGEGYISARNGYEMDSLFYQLNTSANEGNSGSPVINENGELLGIISAKETKTDGVVFAAKSINLLRAIEEANKLSGTGNIKTSSRMQLRGISRTSQIKKVQDYIFMVKGI